MNITIQSVDYHRNGVCGSGFNVVLFKFRDGKKLRNMVAVVYPERGYCSVLDIDKLSMGAITSETDNQWRGDHFEDQMRQAIKEYEASVDEALHTNL